MKGQRSEGKKTNGPSLQWRGVAHLCLHRDSTVCLHSFLDKKTYRLQNTHESVKEVFKWFFTQHPARSVVNTLLSKPTHTSKDTIYLFLPRTSASLILVRMSFRLDPVCSPLTVSIIILLCLCDGLVVK